MTTITDRDIREQVATAVGAAGTDLTAGINVDAIVTEIINTYGLINVDDIDDEAFWDMVERHDAALAASMQEDPCSGGRCTDPAAHAEGAHDV